MKFEKVKHSFLCFWSPFTLKEKWLDKDDFRQVLFTIFASPTFQKKRTIYGRGPKTNKLAGQGKAKIGLQGKVGLAVYTIQFILGLPLFILAWPIFSVV